MNSHNRTLWILLVGLICYGQSALSQSHNSGSGAGWDRGLDHAVARARERTGGRVLSAETRDVDGRPTYFVRMLTKDGKVRRLRIDASTEERTTPRKGR